ncbi:hypothetical protein LVD15_21795 [Fulvivirga maritima]|uniref:hypothetical protein n=1 Tax=Fulvivirga maritima TaxID=2904247 RepID=UPI001F477479|nr:hypothetical protein [Fulvivirga maritima]UII25906.1 hypothetical protein LVD15_21795 [Fulvivirga maritima]
MGNGHWMKAIAIRAALKERGVDAEIVDESQALSPGAEKAMKFFEGIYNMASKSRVLQKINEFISSGKNSYLAGWFEIADGASIFYWCSQCPRAERANTFCIAKRAFVKLY